MAKYLIVLVLSMLVSSCQNGESITKEERKTFAVQSTNLDIKNTAGIDLLKFKSKVDEQFPEDSLYLKVCEDILFNTGKSKILEKLGPIATYDNGDSIYFSHRDSLFKCIYQSLAKNIYLNDCKENNADSVYCNMKRQTVINLSSVDGVFTLTPTGTIGDVYDQYNYGNLNYEELSYMVIVHHLLRDIYHLEK